GRANCAKRLECAGLPHEMFQPMALPGPAPVISWGEPALSNDPVLAKAGASSRTPNASAEFVCIRRFWHFGLEVRWEPRADAVNARPGSRDVFVGSGNKVFGAVRLSPGLSVDDAPARQEPRPTGL